MAAKESKKAQAESLIYYDIKEMKEKAETPEHIFCGVCSAKDWKNGKKVTEDEYKEAVQMFLNNPMGRRKKNA